MSQRPPKGKSPDCETQEDRSRTRILEQIQRETERELLNAERLLDGNDVGVASDPRNRVSAAATPRTMFRNYNAPTDSTATRSQRTSFAMPRSARPSIATGPHTLSYKYSARPTNTPEFGSQGSSILGGESRKLSLPQNRHFLFETPMTSDVFFTSNPHRVVSEGDLRPKVASELPQASPHPVRTSRFCVDDENSILKNEYMPRPGTAGGPSGTSKPYSDGSACCLTRMPSRNTSPEPESSSSNPGRLLGGSSHCCHTPSPDPPNNRPKLRDTYDARATSTAYFDPPRAFYSGAPATTSTTYFEPPRTHYSGMPVSATPSTAYFEPPRAHYSGAPPTPSTSYFEPPRAHYSGLPSPAAPSTAYFEPPRGAHCSGAPGPAMPSTSHFRPPPAHLPGPLPNYPLGFPRDPVFGAEEQAKLVEQKLARLQKLSQITQSDRSAPCSRMMMTKADSSLAMLDAADRPVHEGRHLPKKPELTMQEIKQLIQCEAMDIESARVLSDERKNYKKPCPKQQKAQMDVKTMVSSYMSPTPGQNYASTVEPDPDDMSPEVAAKLMFSQEEGVGLEACPSVTVRRLFPENRKRSVYDRGNKVSVFDPREEEEIIKKSAVVPEGGASDSAYSRTMKDKGEEVSHKSCEGENCGSQQKREYVLLAQKPVRFNRVQFRGDLPQWFPGYFAAFPDQPRFNIVGSPTAALNKAWAMTNPSNIPSTDVVIMES